MKVTVIMFIIGALGTVANRNTKLRYKLMLERRKKKKNSTAGKVKYARTQ